MATVCLDFLFQESTPLGRMCAVDLDLKDARQQTPARD